MDRGVRLLLVFIAGGVLGVFAVALSLNPYKDGRVWLSGTHEQLHLSPCSFKVLTGFPCPACGMTSSFALLVRGDVAHSVEANYVGTLLALAGMLFIPWGLVSALRGRWLFVRDVERTVIYSVFGFFAFMLVRWAIVLFSSVYGNG